MTITRPDVSTPAGILRLANSFCDAKAVLTAVSLDLHTALHDGPATESEIREKLGLHGRGLSDFLRLLVELGLLERDGDKYRNAPGADTYLVRGAPSYIGGFLLRSDRNLYPAWGRLAEALRTGAKQSAGDFELLLAQPTLLRQFIGMMDALTQQLAPELAAAIDWSEHGSVLDVGGCRGNLVANLVKAHPALRGHVFDLPQMEPFFNELAEEMGVADRMRFHPGDFFADSATLPSADVVVLGHVLHDWSPEQRSLLFRKAAAAVNPGGVLLVYDRMLREGPGLVENLVISLDMLLVTDGGSEYPPQEIRSYAQAAGFASVTERPLGDFDTLVICRKGAAPAAA